MSLSENISQAGRLVVPFECLALHAPGWAVGSLFCFHSGRACACLRLPSLNLPPGRSLSDPGGAVFVRSWAVVGLAGSWWWNLSYQTGPAGRPGPSWAEKCIKAK